MRFRTLAIVLLPLALLAACGHRAERERALLDVGRRAADAQEFFFQNAPGPAPRYARTLEELIAYDPTLAQDAGLTFSFGDEVSTGYVLTVRETDRWHVRCRPIDACVVREKD